MMTFSEIVICPHGRLSAWEDEARRRAMREQSAFAVHYPPFGRADTTAAAQDLALSSDLACLGVIERTREILNSSVV